MVKESKREQFHSVHVGLCRDTVLETIEEVGYFADGTELIYISANAPPGITNRDFVHLRSTNQQSDSKSRVIVDMSAESPKVPEKSSHVRCVVCVLFYIKLFNVNVYVVLH